jgi:hypothetical protein
VVAADRFVGAAAVARLLVHFDADCRTRRDAADA